MFAIIEGQAEIEPSDAPLGANVVTHRRAVLNLFAPSRAQPRKQCTVLALASLLNSDWRVKNRLLHRCTYDGCCQSRAHLVQKLKATMKQVLKSLKPSRLCRGSWKEWPRPMKFFITAYMHDFLGLSFRLAFDRPPQDGMGITQRNAMNAHS